MANPEGVNPDDSSLPIGSEANPVAVDYKKRYTDTQSAYTKVTQDLKASKAKLEVLEKLVTPKVEIDTDKAAELETLKFSDPEKWRNELNKLEIDANSRHTANLNEAVTQVSRETELENRGLILAEFQKRNPNLVINDEVIKYDVPPRISNRLENGEITFEQYLTDVSDYLGAGKVIGDGNVTTGQPNISNVGGGSTPSKDAVKGSITDDYKNIVY